MTSPQIETYLRRLAHELAQRGIVGPRIVEEARDHLVDAIERAEQRGLSMEAAAQEAFARFGSAETVAARFAADRHHTQTVLTRLMRLPLAMVAFASRVGMTIRALFADRRGDAGPRPALAWAHDVAARTSRGQPRRTHSIVIARDTASLFASSSGDAVNPGIADSDTRATDTLRQLMMGAAKGAVDPTLIAPDARERLVPALAHLGPALGRLGAIESLTLLEETRIRRYRVQFAGGHQGNWTVVHAADGSILSLVRMESTDERWSN